MGTITFDYDSWDTSKDVRLHRPGNTLGYTAIKTSLNVGRRATRREEDQDALIGEAIEGIIGLIAGGIEWLRWFGLSAAEVQSRVRAYKAANLDRGDQQVLKAAQEAIEEIPNPKRYNLSKIGVIG